jgi:hypothetical protein
MPRALHTIRLPHPAYLPSQKFLALAVISSLALATFAYAYEYAHQPYIQAINNSSEIQANGGSALNASSSSSVDAVTEAMLEMNIANDGLVYLGSAHVDSVSGNVITVTIAWGSSTFDWVIDTTTGKGGTQFIKSGGEAGSINDIMPGDLVAITGMLDQDMSAPTLDAQFVRE